MDWVGEGSVPSLDMASGCAHEGSHGHPLPEMHLLTWVGGTEKGVCAGEGREAGREGPRQGWALGPPIILTAPEPHGPRQLAGCSRLWPGVGGGDGGHSSLPWAPGPCTPGSPHTPRQLLYCLGPLLRSTRAGGCVHTFHCDSLEPQHRIEGGGPGGRVLLTSDPGWQLTMWTAALDTLKVKLGGLFSPGSIAGNNLVF